MRLVCALAEYRGKRTISEMARVAGVSRANLSQIEAGVRLPSDDEVEKIVDAYDAELEQLYEWRAPQFLAVALDPKDES